MKKILSLVLAAIMVFAFAACGEKNETLKFGMGVYVYKEAATSAEGDVNGSGDVIATVAAVLLDKDSKIVKCELDTIDCAAEYTSNGEAVVGDSFKTKYELGKDYNMAAYGQDINGDGIVKEWFEQTDAFEALTVGKTVDEVKALLGENSYNGNNDVMAAGCTMGVSDFIIAIEAAVKNAADSTATANDTLGVGIAANAEGVNASDEANGSVTFEINMVAAVKSSDGKVLVCDTDVADVELLFNNVGVAADSDTAVVTKKAAGKDYGMVAYGQDLNGDGVVKEWFEQAAAFNAACAGKNAEEIAALAVNGYGVESLQTAGCTIAVSGMVNAAAKAAK